MKFLSGRSQAGSALGRPEKNRRARSSRRARPNAAGALPHAPPALMPRSGKQSGGSRRQSEKQESDSATEERNQIPAKAKSEEAGTEQEAKIGGARRSGASPGTKAGAQKGNSVSGATGEGIRIPATARRPDGATAGNSFPGEARERG